MIGRLTTPNGTVATLMDNLSWRSADARLRRYLRDRWPSTAYSPADGEPGWAMLQQAAAALGGEVEILAEPTPLEEGDIP